MEEEIIIIEEPEQVVEIIDAEASEEKAVIVTHDSEIKHFESELIAVNTRLTAQEGFNEGITFDLIEDSAIDREKRLPTDAKMAKVKKIGGMSQKIGDELITAKVESVNVTGKNLFDWSKWSGMACNNNGIAVYNDANLSMTITAQDKADAYTRFDPGSFGNWLKAKPNTTYTLSWTPTATNMGKAFLFENGETTVLRSGASNVGHVTFTTSENAKFLTFRVGVNNSGDTVTWSNLQIEEGDTATGYEEYKAEKTIKLSSRLKEIELYGISEDVHDYIDFERKILVRMCRVNSGTVEPLASPSVTDISYIIDDEPIAQPFNCKDGYISFEQAQAIKLDVPNTIDYYVKGASPKVIADITLTEETTALTIPNINSKNVQVMIVRNGAKTASISDEIRVNANNTGRIAAKIARGSTATAKVVSKAFFDFESPIRRIEYGAVYSSGGALGLNAYYMQGLELEKQVNTLYFVATGETFNIGDRFVVYGR